MLKSNDRNLGIKALASSAVSGHEFAKQASSNLWSFFFDKSLKAENETSVHWKTNF